MHCSYSNPCSKLITTLILGASPSSLYPNTLPGAAGPQIDIIGAYLNRLYSQGIVVVCSAGNLGRIGAPLNALTPRLHGGANTPLIVVGSTTFDGNRFLGSQVVDPNGDGILSIYANGVDILSAWFQGDDEYTTATGTSEATATTSGMVAYFLANDALQAQFAANGLNNVASNVKAYLIHLGIQMKGTARTDPNTTPNTPDPVPRLANGETVDCTQQNGQITAPAYVTAASPQLNLAATIFQVTDGTNVILPQNLLVCNGLFTRFSHYR